MALFGLGISAVVKGAGGLFRAVRNKVKQFKAKRKQSTAEFKSEIKKGFGMLDPYATGETFAPPSNPLGVMQRPVKPMRVALGADATPVIPTKVTGSGVLAQISRLSMPVKIGLAGLAGLGIYLATRNKKRKRR